MVGKHFCQIVFKACRALRAFIVSRWAVACEYFQFTAGDDLVKRSFIQQLRQAIEYEDDNAEYQCQYEKQRTAERFFENNLVLITTFRLMDRL